MKTDSERQVALFAVATETDTVALKSMSSGLPFSAEVALADDIWPTVRNAEQ